MGLKAAIQALKKAEELKARVSQHSDLLNNSEAWSDQQQLQTVYHQVLVLDLEYALDKKVEQELWTLGFKNHIAALQHLSRDKKNPRRSECQALLSWCLEAASGFYLTLLQELCSTFDLDLPFRRRSAIYGQNKPWPNSEQLIQPHKSSCLYICQYCLVHLGDIARYRSQRKQAESFYRHAILLSPSSGQPYNQLALLEASRGDKLATVFHYVRSIAVKYPFPAAATNLANTFSALIDNEEDLQEINSKLTQNEFTLTFLKVHGLLHSVTELDKAEMYMKTLNATFTALVATQMFTLKKLIQMTAINMYALRHTVDSLSSNQLTKDELKVKHLVMELLAGALNAYLLPIYTMNDSTTLMEYYALPAIKLTLDWIKSDPSILNDVVFIKRLQLWPSLCKLLNNLQTNVEEFNANKYIKVPLPEDRELQCFLPLTSTFRDLDFNTENLSYDAAFYNKLRVLRLVEHGSWLCTQNVNNNVVITSKKQPDSKNLYFEPEKKQPDPTTELLEELKHFNIHENITGIKDAPTNSAKTIVKASSEKRGGILKPQGSLEKAREERNQVVYLSENDTTSCNTSLSNSSQNSVRNDTIKSKRSRQNVAMQTLTKKVDDSNKQVTFHTELSIKTIDKLQPKTNEKNQEIPIEINSEAMRQKEFPQAVPLTPNFPASSNHTDLTSSHNYQNSTNPTNHTLALQFNQNQNYQRLNVGSVPFSMQYPSSNPSNILYHNNIPQNNASFPRQHLPSNRPPDNLNTQNNGFNLGFDRNSQSINYQNPTSQMLSKDTFSPWLIDEKLPMPPSAWWTNNQKPVPFRSYPCSQDTYKQSYPYNINTNTNLNFMTDNNKSNVDYNMQHTMNTGNTIGLNNMSIWNSNSNIQSNVPMLMNQPGPSMMQPAQITQPSCKDINRESNSKNMPNPCDLQAASSMPGYSLFNSNWGPNLVHTTLQANPPDKNLIRQQSLFSGPGPSPLERLLEQQKQLRGTKEDT